MSSPTGGPRPGRLLHRVGEAIARRGLWRAGERVAVAVSGGLDSVCLLDLLVATAGWHQGVLSVVTIDHGTRPGSADDAAFVVERATALGIAVTRRDLALGEEASEDTARKARFEVLDALDVDAVALAHHQGDQAETVLINLLRGTGPGGLEGMAWRRGRYVRPLLDVSRADLVEWASQRSLSWRDDPTNASDRFLRNRVRNEVLPLLEDLRPGSTAALARSATLATEQGALLDALLEAEPGASPDALSTPWLATAPPALARRALHRSFAPLTTAHADAILAAAATGSGRVGIGSNRIVVVDAIRTRLVR